MCGQPNTAALPQDLVVCCDGTWSGHLFGTNSNIKLFASSLAGRFAPEDDCWLNEATGALVRYFPGVGASDPNASLIDFGLDGAVATDLDERILEAYHFIVANFRPGMRVWLFGFSRGAYTVRCVAGLIHNCGILKQSRGLSGDNLQLLEQEANRIYRSREERYRPSSPFCKEFRRRHSHAVEVPIKFMGLLDTVAAHGLPQLGAGHFGGRYELYDDRVSSSVERVVQALAVHDRLTFFEPVLTARSNPADHPMDEEVWFPGSHYDIGGSRFVFGRIGASPLANALFFVQSRCNILRLNVSPEKELADRVALWMLRTVKDAAPSLLPREPTKYLTDFGRLERPPWLVWRLVSRALFKDVGRDAYDELFTRFGQMGLGLLGGVVSVLQESLLGDRHIPQPPLPDDARSDPPALVFHKLEGQSDEEAQQAYNQGFVSKAFQRCQLAAVVRPRFVS